MIIGQNQKWPEVIRKKPQLSENYGLLLHRLIIFKTIFRCQYKLLTTIKFKRFLIHFAVFSQESSHEEALTRFQLILSSSFLDTWVFPVFVGLLYGLDISFTKKSMKTIILAVLALLLIAQIQSLTITEAHEGLRHHRHWRDHREDKRVDNIWERRLRDPKEDAHFEHQSGRDAREDKRTTRNWSRRVKDVREDASSDQPSRDKREDRRTTRWHKDVKEDTRGEATSEMASVAKAYHH